MTTDTSRNAPHSGRRGWWRRLSIRLPRPSGWRGLTRKSSRKEG